jgi:hypothetical protein
MYILYSDINIALGLMCFVFNSSVPAGSQMFVSIDAIIINFFEFKSSVPYV